MELVAAIGFGVALCLSAYSAFQSKGNVLSVAVVITTAVLFVETLNGLGVTHFK